MTRSAIRNGSLGMALAMTLAACATGSRVPPLALGQETTVEGTIASVDTTPLAYDGDALVAVSDTAHGAVTVHLPARWNLCKAQHVVELSTLAAGDRIRATGTATGPGDITVCEQPSHRLLRLGKPAR